MNNFIYVVFEYTDYRKENYINILGCFTDMSKAFSYADKYVLEKQEQEPEPMLDTEDEYNPKPEPEHQGYVSASGNILYDKYITYHSWCAIEKVPIS